MLHATNRLFFGGRVEWIDWKNKMQRDFDIIGDIHGYAEKLRQLVDRLGYRESLGAYKHPEGRVAVFVGDLMDRGPEQIETMKIVRKMVDAGSALCIMGNHELNAIGFATPDEKSPGQFLRKHTENNIHHHAEFLEQVKEGSGNHKDWVSWFKTLPLFLDLEDLRVVHAWWHQPYVDYVKKELPDGLAGADAFIQSAFDKTHIAYESLEGITKGLEIDLPAGVNFTDAGGTVRERSRVKWWNADASTYGQALMLPGREDDDNLQGLLPDTLPLGLTDDVPVFIGHYWLTGKPTALAPRIACLDYSAAKNGPLVAYRWDGNPDIAAENFVRSDGVECVAETKKNVSIRP